MAKNRGNRPIVIQNNVTQKNGMGCLGCLGLIFVVIIILMIIGAFAGG